MYIASCTADNVDENWVLFLVDINLVSCLFQCKKKPDVWCVDLSYYLICIYQTRNSYNARWSHHNAKWSHYNAKWSHCYCGLEQPKPLQCNQSFSSFIQKIYFQCNQTPLPSSFRFLFYWEESIIILRHQTVSRKRLVMFFY